MQDEGLTKRPLFEVTRALLRPGGLQDQAKAALRRTLAADPRNMDALWKLAEIHRRQGNFAAAHDCYRHLQGRGPEPRKAAWLHAMLSGIGGAPEPAPGGIWPAPFVRMTNFLAPGECDRLLAMGLAAHLVPSPVGSKPHVDPEARISLEVDGKEETEIIVEVRRLLVPKIKSLMPEILARLRIGDIGQYGIEMGMRVYLNGGFYRPHRDNSARIYSARSISFVYFFNRQPPRFSGGDLLLYDCDVHTDARSYGKFSRFVPLRNSIVLFPSACWHRVTPVQGCTDDRGDGRWALNGHVWRRHADDGWYTPRLPASAKLSSSMPWKCPS